MAHFANKESFGASIMPADDKSNSIQSYGGRLVHTQEDTANTVY